MVDGMSMWTPRAGVHGLIKFMPGKLDGWGAAAAAAHRRARRDRGPPGEADGILPWDKVDTPNGPVPWAQFCRGGGRAADSAVLEGLQEFLGRFRNAAAQEDKAEVQGSGKNKGKRGKGDGGKAASSSTPSTPLEANAGNKGKGQGSSVRNEGELLAELERLVARAKQDPNALLDDLQGLARRAAAGYGSGRAARRHRANLAKRTAEDHGSVDKQHVKPVEPEFCRPVGGDDDGSAPWTVVARRRGQDNVQPPVQNWIVDPLAGGVVSSAVAVKRISEGLPLQASGGCPCSG